MVSTVWAMASTMSQSDWKTALGVGYLMMDCSRARSTRPELSVARVPVMVMSDFIQFRSLYSRRTMLSIPWPSDLNDCGSWPSTGPAPNARRVLSDSARTQPKVPWRETAEPSLQARNDCVVKSLIISGGGTKKVTRVSRLFSQGSR